MNLAPVDYGSEVTAASGKWLDVLSGLAKPFLEGELQRRYGGGSGLADRLSVNAFGEVRPAGQPATISTPLAGAVGDVLKNPVTWVLGAVALAAVVLLVRR